MSDSPQNLEKGLSLPNPPEIIENDLPLVNIPTGNPNKEDPGNYLKPGNEPSEQVLREFFTPEMQGRLIICPQINRDVTDGSGMFGYDPGYIFIRGVGYKGIRTWNDDAMLRGTNSRDITTEDGVSLMMIPHFDDFPLLKYDFTIITPSEAPKTYQFLNGLIKPEKLLQDAGRPDLSKKFIVEKNSQTTA